MLRIILILMVLFGIIAGLHQAAVPGYTCARLDALHAKEHAGHPHDSQKPCDPAHDRKCPVDHHNLRSCCHGMPLAEPGDLVVRLNVPWSQLSRFRADSDRLPDGPCLSEDVPPLI